MMKRLLIAVVGIQVLLHAMFGCCWHPFRACACSAVAVEHAATVTHLCHEQCRGHDVAHSHEPRDAAGHDDGQTDDDHLCCRDTCTWICDSTNVELMSDDAWQFLSAGPVDGFDVSAMSVAALANLAHGDQSPALSVRLHLALGVFLI